MIGDPVHSSLIRLILLSLALTRFSLVQANGIWQEEITNLKAQLFGEEATGDGKKSWDPYETRALLNKLFELLPDSDQPFKSEIEYFVSMSWLDKKNCDTKYFAKLRRMIERNRPNSSDRIKQYLIYFGNEQLRGCRFILDISSKISTSINNAKDIELFKESLHEAWPESKTVRAYEEISDETLHQTLVLFQRNPANSVNSKRFFLKRSKNKASLELTKQLCQIVTSALDPAMRIYNSLPAGGLREHLDPIEYEWIAVEKTCTKILNTRSGTLARGHATPTCCASAWMIGECLAAC